MDKKITLRDMLSLLNDTTCNQVTVVLENFSISLSPSNLLSALNDKILDREAKSIYPVNEHCIHIECKEN